MKNAGSVEVRGSIPLHSTIVLRVFNNFIKIDIKEIFKIMGKMINNSVKMENGYKLAGLYNQQKKMIVASQKQKESEQGAVNSDKAKPSDARKAQAKAKAKKAKQDRKRNQK